MSATSARAFALGDPQASLARLKAQLERTGALGGDGRLASDVALLSMGDHFDYAETPGGGAGGAGEDRAAEGVEVLRWLSGHEPGRVRILFGNHDAARVMELVGCSDASFGEARDLACEVAAGRATETEFRRRFPEIPTFDLARRDFSCFSEAQRDLVIELLLAGRFQLAAVGTLPGGREALFTHAGVTCRELILLGLLPTASPRAIADRLNQFLAERIDAVRARWQAGERVPLSLKPLHAAGVAGDEGGGMLYHRPADPDPPNASAGDQIKLLPWKFNGMRPRRFDPRTLPGVVQVCGHTPHRKCAAELRRWCRPGLRDVANGPLRTLAVQGEAVDYGPFAPELEGAVLHMIDGDLARTPVERFELLSVEGFSG